MIQSLFTEAKNLTKLIDYQEGAVVSLTLIDKPAGTITLFVFDKDQGLSEHKTPFDAFVNVIDGEAQVTIDSKIHIVKSGEAIILPANIPHALKALRNFKMILTMIK